MTKKTLLSTVSVLALSVIVFSPYSLLAASQWSAQENLDELEFLTPGMQARMKAAPGAYETAQEKLITAKEADRERLTEDALMKKDNAERLRTFEEAVKKAQSQGEIVALWAGLLEAEFKDEKLKRRRQQEAKERALRNPIVKALRGEKYERRMREKEREETREREVEERRAARERAAAQAAREREEREAAIAAIVAREDADLEAARAAHERAKAADDRANADLRTAQDALERAKDAEEGALDRERAALLAISQKIDELNDAARATTIAAAGAALNKATADLRSRFDASYTEQDALKAERAIVAHRATLEAYKRATTPRHMLPAEASSSRSLGSVPADSDLAAKNAEFANAKAAYRTAKERVVALQEELRVIRTRVDSEWFVRAEAMRRTEEAFTAIRERVERARAERARVAAAQ